MKIIGLTGGIASGKSAVAAELARLGAVVLDADRAAHETLDFPEVQAELVERWGNSIVRSQGQVDRAKVAQIVFGDHENASDELRFLEKTLHPRIRLQFENRIAEVTDDGAVAAVIDAPLLLEAGWNSLCDYVLFVDSSRELRLARAIRRNWTEAEFSKREGCQMPIEEKRLLSSHVLANLGSLEELRNQVRTFWSLAGLG
ncbi:MAG: dephospho-CoA kinase [Planctomycetota bacterium]